MEDTSVDSKKKPQKLTAFVAGVAVSLAALSSGCDYMFSYSNYPRGRSYHSPYGYRRYPHPPPVRRHKIVPAPRPLMRRPFNNGPYGNPHYRSTPRSPFRR